MQLITDILIATLMAYLALTNSLAEGISHLLGETDTGEESEIVPSPTALTPLPSSIARIPDVLLRSALYQQAAVITSTPPLTTTPAAAIDAIVNIYCTFTTDTHIRTTTGTGFFVSNQGVIMTNAHVAQFLLLEHSGALGEADCTIRAGSPAAPRYTAELLYLPPAWVTEHASLINAAAPTGTGERDYALLYVTATTETDTLPASFPALPLATDLLPHSIVGSSITAAGYPAGTPGQDTATNLLAASATTSISELFTFGSNYADVIALRGSTLGQQGASGGPIVNSDGAVIGMITTRGNDTKDGAGSLRAITLSHINRTITEETGSSLETNIATNIKTRADAFTATMAPFLTTLLTSEIN